MKNVCDTSKKSKIHLRKKGFRKMLFSDYEQKNHTHYSDKNVESGSWVLVKCRIPVDEKVRPQIYGIYWAIPKEDLYGRQKVAIYTPTEVCLLNHEYTVISKEKLQLYIEDGYYLHDCGTTNKKPLDRNLIEQGRSLCQEEREIIDALMLDGLTEQQACEEYFYTHHVDGDNIGLCYLPTDELLKQIVAVFGENGMPG